MTYHAYEKALSIIREVVKRKEYFHPCREDKVVLLMLVNMPERLTLLTSRYSKVIINTEETASCFNTSKYLNTVYIDNIT